MNHPLLKNDKEKAPMKPAERTKRRTAEDVPKQPYKEGGVDKCRFT
jgi:hypothetical protein